MGYGDVVKGVKDSILNAIKATTSFSASNTFADYYKSLEGISYPVAFLRLREDRHEMSGPSHTYHHLIWRIELHNKGTGTESDLESIIDYVGEIVDQIESNRTLGNSNIQTTEVTRISYSWRRIRSAVFYYAFIEIDTQVIRVSA